MSNILLTGLNHETANVELRECLAFSTEETKNALPVLLQNQELSEVLIFSTCNRVEIVVVTKNPEKALEIIKTFLSEYKSIPLSDFEKSLYIHHDKEAVRHIFRVASSLDSMMVGEPQILGQIKKSFLAASSKKTSGVILNRLLHKTFFVAKKVRSETGIGDNAVSISYAATELARKIFGTLDEKKVLLIGAGEMAELAVEHLIKNRTGKILVANRTFENGVTLAKKFNGQAIRFEEITGFLQEVDIIISSTGSLEYVITKNQVKKVMKNRRNKSIFFIDIAVPRDIDPKVNKIANSYLYDIDDLKGVINDNIEERKNEAVKAERIVDESVIRFNEWFDNLEVVPTIIALKNKMESIAVNEIEKTVNSMKSISKDDSVVMEKMVNSIINKIIHDPIDFLKKTGHHHKESVYLNVTRNLFKLDD